MFQDRSSAGWIHLVIAQTKWNIFGTMKNVIQFMGDGFINQGTVGMSPIIKKEEKKVDWKMERKKERERELQTDRKKECKKERGKERKRLSGILVSSAEDYYPLFVPSQQADWMLTHSVDTVSPNSLIQTHKHPHMPQRQNNALYFSRFFFSNQVNGQNQTFHHVSYLIAQQACISGHVNNIPFQKTNWESARQRTLLKNLKIWHISIVYYKVSLF